jgi:hypothetical protein
MKGNNIGGGPRPGQLYPTPSAVGGCEEHIKPTGSAVGGCEGDGKTDGSSTAKDSSKPVPPMDDRNRDGNEI